MFEKNNILKGNSLIRNKFVSRFDFLLDDSPKTCSAILNIDIDAGEPLFSFQPRYRRLRVKNRYITFATRQKEGEKYSSDETCDESCNDLAAARTPRS